MADETPPAAPPPDDPAPAEPIAPTPAQRDDAPLAPPGEAPHEEAVVTDATTSVDPAPADEGPAQTAPADEGPAPPALPEEGGPVEATAAQTAPSEPAAGEPPRRRSGRPRGGKSERRPRRERAEQGAPREKGPLPFAELREAAAALTEIFGARQALRDAFSVLGDKERTDLARLVDEDGEWRVRARNIAAGSLGAGRMGKALAAQQISMATVEDLWPLTLSKEEAADRLARVRNARRSDERRAQRSAERAQSSDRVSRAELAKAQDGRVGAQIRIVMPGEPRGERRRKDAPDQDKPRKGDEPNEGTNSVLDRLGY